MIVNPTPHYALDGLKDVDVIFIGRNPGRLVEANLDVDIIKAYEGLESTTPADERMAVKNTTFEVSKMKRFLDALGYRYVMLNVVKCATKGNLYVPLVVQMRCKKWLQQQLSILDPKLIVTLGWDAAKAIDPTLPTSSQLSKQRVKLCFGYALVNCPHPSHMRYDTSFGEQMKESIAKAIRMKEERW